MYDINEVTIQPQKSSFSPQLINKLFPEENMVPRTLFEAGEVAGSAKYKQSKTV